MAPAAQLVMAEQVEPLVLLVLVGLPAILEEVESVARAAT